MGWRVQAAEESPAGGGEARQAGWLGVCGLWTWGSAQQVSVSGPRAGGTAGELQQEWGGRSVLSGWEGGL